MSADVRCGQCGQRMDAGAKEFFASGEPAIRALLDDPVAPACTCGGAPRSENDLDIHLRTCDLAIWRQQQEQSESFQSWAARTGKLLEDEINGWMQKSEQQKRDIDYLLEQQRAQLARADLLIEAIQKLQRDFDKVVRQRDEGFRQRDSAIAQRDALANNAERVVNILLPLFVKAQEGDSPQEEALGGALDVLSGWFGQNGRPLRKLDELQKQIEDAREWLLRVLTISCIGSPEEIAEAAQNGLAVLR